MTQVKKDLGLQPDDPSLLIFDVFKGQLTSDFLQKLQANNFLYVFVPANCAGLLQPLDLSVNKAAKDHLKKSFQTWYASEITKQLDSGVSSSNLKAVDMQGSIMKMLNALWFLTMFDYLCSNPNIIINGFKEAGIK